MTDTHTHLYLPEFSLEGQAPGSMAGQCRAVDEALSAGVSRMIFPNVDRSTVAPMMKLHEMRPDNTFMAMGLHPTEIKDNWQEELEYTTSVFKANPGSFVAVGEVGIDLYWDKTFEDEQMQALERQMQLAREYGKPVIIHCREGLDQTLEVWKDYSDVNLVFHSFGGSIADVERIKRQGDPCFGINGIVTFKNSSLGEVLPAIGLERILTETDSPYLAPVPKRGRRNESAYIPYIVGKVADFLSISAEEVARQTDTNASKFFKIQ